jgi:hypothetical protein
MPVHVYERGNLFYHLKKNGYEPNHPVIGIYAKIASDYYPDHQNYFTTQGPWQR